jgi:hypothetical protein
LVQAHLEAQKGTTSVVPFFVSRRRQYAPDKTTIEFFFGIKADMLLFFRIFVNELEKHKKGLSDQPYQN